MNGAPGQPCGRTSWIRASHEPAREPVAPLVARAAVVRLRGGTSGRRGGNSRATAYLAVGAGCGAANHVALAGAGLWPRSQWLGPNWIQLPAQIGCAGGVAITIDDGPDPGVTPRVLAQLEQHRACATFFCVGERVLRYPDLAREIVRRGHTIENHSQRHRHNFSLLGPKGMHGEIARAQDSIARVTGSCPGFFRAPAGLRNPFLDPVLRRMHLQLASWTRRGFDTVNGDAEVVFRRLATALQGGDILLLHDGNAARGRDGTAGDPGGAAAPARCAAQQRSSAGHAARGLVWIAMTPLLLSDFTATSCIGQGLAPTLTQPASSSTAGSSPATSKPSDIDTYIGEVPGVDAHATAAGLAALRLPQQPAGGTGLAAGWLH